MNTTRRIRIDRVALPLIAAAALTAAAVLALAGAASPLLAADLSRTHAGTLDDPIPIRFGVTYRGTMPPGRALHGYDSDRWKQVYVGLLPDTRRVLQVEGAPPGPLTVEVHSLDFQIGVRHRVPDTLATAMPAIHLDWMDNIGGTVFPGRGSCPQAHTCLLLLERKGNDAPLIEVFPAWGDSGGEFEVRLLPGEPGDPVAREPGGWDPGIRLPGWVEWERRARERANVEREWYTVHHQARLLLAEDRIDEAGPAVERATELAERLATPDDFRLAHVLGRVTAQLAQARGDREAARELRKRAKAIQTDYWERYLTRARESGDREAEWTALRYGGVWGLQHGRFKDELPDRHVRMIEIARELYVPGDLRSGLRLAESLRTAAKLPGNDRTHEEKTRHLEECLEVSESVLGAQHEYLIYRLLDLANLYAQAGRLDEALGLVERMPSICQANHEPGHWHFGEGFILAGRLEAELGRYHDAKEHIETGVDIYEKALPPEAWNLFGAFASLGWLNEKLGAYEEARGVYERAYEIRERTFGASDLNSIGLLGAMSTLLVELGRPDEAWNIVVKIQDAAADRGEDVDPARVAALVHIPAGKVLLALDRREEAREEADRAAALALKTKQPESSRWQRLYSDLAQLYRDLGDPERARPWAERAVDLSRQAYGAEHPETARCLTVLAGVLGDLGATEALETALRAERVGRDDVRVASGVLSERRALEFAAARAPALDVAVDVAAAAETVAPAISGDLLDAVIRSRSLVLDEVGARNRAAAEATRISRDSPDSADDAAKQARKIAALYEKVGSASTRLANLLVRDPEWTLEGGEVAAEDRKLYADALTSARREKEEAEEALAVQSAAFRDGLARKRAGFAEVSSSLPREASLVSFKLYERGRSGAAEPTRAYAAFVLAPGERFPAFVSLGPAADVHAAVSRWQQEVSLESAKRGFGGVAAARPDAAEAPPSSMEASYRKAGAELRRLAWDPIAGHLGAAKRVLIVPDGALSLVSFASLPAAESGYLLEKGPVIHYLSAERDLVATRSEGRRGGNLLALGGVDFEADALFAALRSGDSGGRWDTARETDTEVARIEGPIPPSDAAPGEAGAMVATLRPFRGDRSACVAFKEREFEPLPASNREVEEIAALWETAAPGARRVRAMPDRGGRAAEGADSATRLTGMAASETAFKHRGPGSRVLHVATHGFFLGGRCRSALEPRRGPGVVTAAGASKHHSRNEEVEAGTVAAPGRAEGENPLVLSGLVLAGANNREHAARDEDDGILTAQEIAATDLSSVEWAVLSACDTGVGEIRAGEGVFGLRRAFQVAGAGTLIMSLWSVEDESTRAWMKALYEGRLTKGMDTAEAVRHASLTVLQDRRDRGLSDHPFYWGAFVAAGDWR